MCRLFNPNSDKAVEIRFTLDKAPLYPAQGLGRHQLELGLNAQHRPITIPAQLKAEFADLSDDACLDFLQNSHSLGGAQLSHLP